MHKSRTMFALVMSLSIAILMAFVLASCSSNSNGSGSASANAQGSSATSSATKSIVIGFDPKYPPYGFIAEDGSYTGFDIDLAAAAAEANGWAFEAKPIDWDARDSELNSGNINCIWNGFTLEGREGQYAFTEPYMINEQVIVARALSGIETLDDLAQKKVVTQSSSSALEVLAGPKVDLAATFEGGGPSLVADYSEAFLQLDSGEVDAVACDLSYAAYQLSQTGNKYVMLDEPLSVEHYAVGFKLGDEETAKIVTNTLKVLYEEGVVEELCRKYENYGVSFTNWVLR